MKPVEKFALVYGLSAFGVGVASYWKGRRGTELLYDTAVYGGMAGTAINVILYATSEGGIARDNGEYEDLTGTGTLPREAVRLVQSIDSDRLYAPMKANGVKVAPVSDNPSIINQDDV